MILSKLDCESVPSVLKIRDTIVVGIANCIPETRFDISNYGGDKRCQEVLYKSDLGSELLTFGF